MKIPIDKTFRVWQPFFCSFAACILVHAPYDSPAADLRARVERAKQQFRPLKEADVQATRAEVRRAMDAVEDFVGRSSEKALRWKKFMMWDRQLAQLTGGEPFDTAFWQSVLDRELMNSPGLEHPAFRYHRAAVREMIDVYQASQNPNLKADYESVLTDLAAALPTGGDRISPDKTDTINRLFARLYHQGQAAELVGAVRQEYSFPNMVLTVPASLVQRVGRGELADEFVINDEINGARIQGEGQLKGTQNLSLTENNAQGVLGIRLSGSTDSTTRGYQDGVTVQTRSVLRFTSTSAVHVTPAGLDVRPFTTAADLNNEIQWISTGRSGRRDEEARRRVYDREQSDRHVAKRRSVDRLNVTFREEVARQLKPAQDLYDEKVRHPLLRRDWFPEQVNVTSSSSQLRIDAVVATNYQLGALAPPPEWGHDSELTLAVHQSVFNNSADVFLAGKTMSLRDAVLRAVALAADADAGAAEEPGGADTDPLQITFSDSVPLRVSLADGEISVVLSGTAYQQGGQRYSGMDLALAFRAEADGGKWWLAQSREPKVMLPKLPDGTRPRLGIRDYALRRILTNIIRRDVPPRSEMEAVRLPPSFDDSRAMAPSTVAVRDGWFCMTVKEVE